MFLRRGQDKVIKEIEKRIADFTFIPAGIGHEHGEGLQILHYEIGQKYDTHFDYFLDEFNTKNGGQWLAILLMYLSDVEEGGETIFPAAKGNFSSVSWWDELSECGKQGLALKPKIGDASLFWSMRPDAKLDPSSLHGGCPVIRGDKWSVFEVDASGGVQDLSSLNYQEADDGDHPHDVPLLVLMIFPVAWQDLEAASKGS